VIHIGFGEDSRLDVNVGAHGWRDGRFPSK